METGESLTHGHNDPNTTDSPKALPTQRPQIPTQAAEPSGQAGGIASHEEAADNHPPTPLHLDSVQTGQPESAGDEVEDLFGDLFTSPPPLREEEEDLVRQAHRPRDGVSPPTALAGSEREVEKNEAAGGQAVEVVWLLMDTLAGQLHALRLLQEAEEEEEEEEVDEEEPVLEPVSTAGSG